jgi:2-polyprenyl-6-methoxyphenol hydroxylase-like FAD-dependent oxidoreductase
LRATVLDARTPPIDKPCGEGILPQGVAALRMLGISLPPESSFPFCGIQFSDQDSSARADFGGATAISIRRVKLHQILVDHAIREGVQFHWGARVTLFEPGVVTTAQGKYSYDWLVGADGQNSQVRKRAGLEPHRKRRKRFGFCTHFRMYPWSDAAEVHWGRECQIFVTPMARREVGIAVLSRDPRLRLASALPRFPFLAEKLRGAVQTTKEWGDATGLQTLPAVARGRVALVGDASGTVDAVTGHGLSLAFQQAIFLADAMKCGSLSRYESAHRRIAAVPAAMSRLMLLMESTDWVRRRTLRLFQNSPRLFSRILSIHAGTLPLSSIGAVDLAGFGWKFLRA